MVTDIIYNFGDNKKGIQFPLVTFCEKKVPYNEKLCEIGNIQGFQSRSGQFDILNISMKTLPFSP